MININIGYFDEKTEFLEYASGVILIKLISKFILFLDVNIYFKNLFSENNLMCLTTV